MQAANGFEPAWEEAHRLSSLCWQDAKRIGPSSSGPAGSVCSSSHLLIVHLGLGGDLAKDHHHACLGGTFAGDLQQQHKPFMSMVTMKARHAKLGGTCRFKDVDLRACDKRLSATEPFRSRVAQALRAV